ncbi:hypothetical protein B0H19DRAFT_1225946, partial [Mycena capillaripes]
MAQKWQKGEEKDGKGWKKEPKSGNSITAIGHQKGSLKQIRITFRTDHHPSKPTTRKLKRIARNLLAQCLANSRHQACLFSEVELLGEQTSRVQQLHDVLVDSPHLSSYVRRLKISILPAVLRLLDAVTSFSLVFERDTPGDHG